MSSNMAAYLQLWQLPVIIAFLLWWLVGGAYVLRRSLRRMPEHRSRSFGQYVLAWFFAGGFALLGAMLAFLLVTRIGRAADANLKRIALVPAAAVAVAMVYLILYAVFQLPLRRLLRACGPSVASVLVSAAIAGAICFIPARRALLRELRVTRSVRHLQLIDEAIRKYAQRHSGAPPASLEALVQSASTGGGGQQAVLDESCLRSPSLPDAKVAYFYLPLMDDGRASKLRACEFTGPDTEQERPVLFANGQARRVPAEEFRRLLSLPENAEFAEQFRAADANR